MADADDAILFEVVPGQLPRVVFRLPPHHDCEDTWQDRPLRATPNGVRLTYHNNSKTLQNSNVLQVILRDHGFDREERLDGDWNIFWCAGQVDPSELRRLKPHQKVNKFPKASVLTLKSNLWVHFARMQRVHGAAKFGYMPQTFLLPNQAPQLEECMAQDMARGDDSTWIVKPAASYCGKGIFLHRASSPAENVQQHRGVACRYLADPFLLDGLKSDIRLYVLVTGWHPLTVYLFEDGLARFATEPYSKDAIDRRCMHLTNYSLNKHSKHFVKNTDAEQDGVGTKWSLAAFKRRVEQALGVQRAKEVWEEVDELVVKTAIASSATTNEGLRSYLPSAARGQPNTQCFQLFGFDVMLDSTGRPWLLEVNLDPALRTESPLDLKIKSAMLVDLLNLIAVQVPSPDAPAEAADAPPHPAAGEAAEAGPAVTAEAEPQGGGEASEVGRAAPHTHTKEQMEAVLRHVNAEYARSKQGRWRRLLPSASSAKYAEFFEPHHHCNALPFDVSP
ncbi:hypothetical protein AB1Y20_005480 [Prymnesium parvum]|uniref:Tubulin--tyrosine ligase-like protein 5 n=1 Tax=Prymnesium parvum TaxID=97485 RepID=A0AB34J4C9_PRYPA